MTLIFILLIVFQLKHFFADYPLQGKYMLGKFKKYPDFILPLLAHAGVHVLFTFIICLFIDPVHAIWYALLDGAIHFTVDRIKASPSMLGRFKALSANEMKEIIEEQRYVERFAGTRTAVEMKFHIREKLKSNMYFWWALGWDQMMHHLTDYLIIFLLVR